MDGEIDGAPATAASTRVIPFGPRGQDFELSLCGAEVPATAVRVFERDIGRIGLAVDGEASEHLLEGEIAHGGEDRRIEGTAHGFLKMRRAKVYPV